ncbi:MAG: hypothetical protein N7Q72_06170 [Spiroplasma sp. Tabriz.8]|nr:hypothetical protein [Spiroplasma sp. Tabriz.8]
MSINILLTAVANQFLVSIIQKNIIKIIIIIIIFKIYNNKNNIFYV